VVVTRVHINEFYEFYDHRSFVPTYIGTCLGNHLAQSKSRIGKTFMYGPRREFGGCAMVHDIEIMHNDG